jgi:hypothetical protein
MLDRKGQVPLVRQGFQEFTQRGETWASGEASLRFVVHTIAFKYKSEWIATDNQSKQ